MISFDRRALFAALASLAGAAALLLAAAAPASAAAPAWRIDALANTTTAPGASMNYLLQISNVGDAASSEPADPTCDPNAPPMDPACLVLSVEVPTGVTATEIGGGGFESARCTGLGVSGPTTVTCASAAVLQIPLESPATYVIPTLSAQVSSNAAGTLTSHFRIAGGGAPAADTVAAFRAEENPPGFGLSAFDNQLTDPAGNVSTRAAAHPYSILTSTDYNTVHNPNPLIGDLWPVAPARDVFVDLPPGTIGNPTAAEECTMADLANSQGPDPRSLCSPDSQVGTVMIRLKNMAFLGGQQVRGPIPVYNVVPPAGVPARFAFNIAGVVVSLDAHLRSSGDYGFTVAARNISEGLSVAGTTFAFWGVPADPGHTHERACPNSIQPWLPEGSTCAAGAAPRAFLRNPSACGAPLPSAAHADSWYEPGPLDAEGEPDMTSLAWRSLTSLSHESPAYPSPLQERGAPVGIEGCEEVPFEPELSVQPTTEHADSPSGLNVDLSVPQECWEAKATVEEAEDSICQSDLKEAEVTLPQGMSVNPASANGLGACTPEQIGLITKPGATPAHFNEKPATCPDSSKVGKVDIETPLLEEHLTGAVYLASQNDNPFNSFLAMYIVAEGAGVVVKQAGEIKIGANGQLTTVFTDTPQTPFSDLHLELFGGQHATLRTPSACGTYTTTSKLTPWSHGGTEGEGGTPIAEPSSSFQISGCPGGGFDPKLDAGTTNPLAGAFSPFILRLTREDGTQELAGLSAKLPEGLLAKLAGIPYCPDSALASLPKEASGEALLGSGATQIASPSCPVASLVGKVTVGAGAGTNPFYTDKGRAYLAGPYKGAPLSIAVIAPAVAGPFDLGSVLVRNALRIDPETAQATVDSDPIPTSLHGIPLDLRDIRVEVNRPSFTLNPTSCNPMALSAHLTSTQGATADLSNRFQVAGCDKLAFKPKLSLKLKGKTNRGAHPAIRAVLTMPPSNQANIARAQVTLPHAEFLDQGHIGTVCTRVQFNSGQGNGAGCPVGSVYGHARAITPILSDPLEGPVYLRSNGGERNLPDLVAALHGQEINVDLVGRIDSLHGQIRNTFETVPDAPVSSFTLEMQGGAKGLLINSTNLCQGKHRAIVDFTGHNGKLHDFNPLIKTDCGGKARKGHRRHR